MGICCNCGVEAALVKSHIIPESFFRELRADASSLLLVSGTRGHFPKRAPIGVYDKEILCKACEDLLLDIDTYGAEVLLSNFDKHFSQVKHLGDTVAFQSCNVDAAKLLQFLVSVLWRASVSNQAFFKTVDLGPYTEIARHVAFGQTSVASTIFDAVMSRWSEANEDSLPTTAMLNPHQERWQGINAYRLYLGNVVAYVKVDKRNFQDPLSGLSLQRGSPIHLVTRSLAGSKDLGAIKKTVRTSEANKRLGRSKYV